MQAHFSTDTGYEITVPVENITSVTVNVGTEFSNEVNHTFMMFYFSMQNEINITENITVCKLEDLNDTKIYEIRIVPKYMGLIFNLTTTKTTIHGVDKIEFNTTEIEPFKNPQDEWEQIEVFKPEPVQCCTHFTSTAIATVSKYCRDIRRIGILLQAVRVVQDSPPLNNLPHTHTHPRGPLELRYQISTRSL
ncbi:hypothetical protein RF11_01602 [Thelohanellus kitauei]|uniref:Uncharacterized protein n=1 Tax=Thelohanellus kitauei TaxID=669202 RepID=A0A0C2J1I8_THEKT|nr:hypothetical protein RF11_01602 [Thelohanellus kitauei]